jgi:hypothetical protein
MLTVEILIEQQTKGKKGKKHDMHLLLLETSVFVASAASGRPPVKAGAQKHLSLHDVLPPLPLPQPPPP